MVHCISWMATVSRPLRKSAGHVVYSPKSVGPCLTLLVSGHPPYRAKLLKTKPAAALPETHQICYTNRWCSQLSVMETSRGPRSPREIYRESKDSRIVWRGWFWNVTVVLALQIYEHHSLLDALSCCRWLTQNSPGGQVPSRGGSRVPRGDCYLGTFCPLLQY